MPQAYQSAATRCQKQDQPCAAFQNHVKGFLKKLTTITIQVTGRKIQVIFLTIKLRSFWVSSFLGQVDWFAMKLVKKLKSIYQFQCQLHFLDSYYLLFIILHWFFESYSKVSRACASHLALQPPRCPSPYHFRHPKILHPA